MAWTQHLPAYGCLELAAPEDARVASSDDEQTCLLQACVEAFPWEGAGESWCLLGDLCPCIAAGEEGEGFRKERAPRSIGRCGRPRCGSSALAKEKLSYAQCLRSMVAVAQAHHGTSWPRFVNVCNAGDLSTLRFQPAAPLILGLVYSAEHYAVVALHGGQAWMYDGLSSQICFDHGHAFVSQLTEEGKYSGSGLQRAVVPPQTNPWCCGRRVVVVMDRLLGLIGCGQGLPGTMAPEDISDAHINRLVELSRMSAAEPEPGSDPGSGPSSGSGAATSSGRPPKRARPNSLLSPISLHPPLNLLDRQRQRLHQPRLVGHRDNGWRGHRADRKSAHLDRFTGRAVQPNGSEQLRLPSRCPRKVWRRSGEKPQNSVGESP